MFFLVPFWGSFVLCCCFCVFFCCFLLFYVLFSGLLVLLLRRFEFLDDIFVWVPLGFGSWLLSLRYC